MHVELLVQHDCVNEGAYRCCYCYPMCLRMCRKLSTHDKMLFEAKPVTRLEEVRPYLANADVIGIDEGQFFPDVRCVCSLYSIVYLCRRMPCKLMVLYVHLTAGGVLSRGSESWESGHRRGAGRHIRAKGTAHSAPIICSAALQLRMSNILSMLWLRFAMCSHSGRSAS